jgi:uncharacterized membrane protein
MRKMLNFLEKYFSTTGLLVGTLFFALSMTPTLLPRNDFTQGLISGLALASGYGVGVLGIWLWSYFEMRTPKEQTQHRVHLFAFVMCLLFAVIFMWRASAWQNSLRALMGMEEAMVKPWVSGVVAVAVFGTVIVSARLLRKLFHILSLKLRCYVPRRVSNIAGLVIIFILFWALVNGVLMTLILRSADSTYKLADSLIKAELEKPTDPDKTGSAESLIAWKDMGFYGRQFASAAPTVEDLKPFAGDDAREPIRVYAGMRSADTFSERAALTLRELIRVKAFERSVMLLITPTGTGWIDPAAVMTLEYLHRGDVASVAAQYSYLPSMLSLMFENGYGAEMARELFQEVYGYWKTLPRDSRPKLYLHGLSLGAMNSDQSFDFFDIIDDPFQGVLWSGPPFRTYTWSTVTEQRDPGSPAWKPRFRGGSVVRFANQDGGLEEGDKPWGSFRIAFLQYASDPITFASFSSSTRKPDWMQEPRGPDVSGFLRWFPIVTTLQLAADMVAGIPKIGYGHEYAASHYLESWLELTEPEGWREEDLDDLRVFFQNYKDPVKTARIP